MAEKLTDSKVLAYKAPKTGRVEYQDEGCPGLFPVSTSETDMRY
jgi:hypothetical protein